MITLVGVGHVFDIAAQGEAGDPGKKSRERYVSSSTRNVMRASPSPGAGGVPFPYKLLAIDAAKRMAHQYGGEVGNEMWRPRTKPRR